MSKKRNKKNEPVNPFLFELNVELKKRAKSIKTKSSRFEIEVFEKDGLEGLYCSILVSHVFIDLTVLSDRTFKFDVYAANKKNYRKNFFLTKGKNLMRNASLIAKTLEKSIRIGSLYEFPEFSNSIFSPEDQKELESIWSKVSIGLV